MPPCHCWNLCACLAAANTPALAQFILSSDGRPCLEGLFTFIENAEISSRNGSSEHVAAVGAPLDPLLAGYFCKVVLGLFSSTTTSPMMSMSMGVLGGDSKQQQGQLAGSMAGFLMERPPLLHAILVRHSNSWSILFARKAQVAEPAVCVGLDRRLRTNASCSLMSLLITKTCADNSV